MRTMYARTKKRRIKYQVYQQDNQGLLIPVWKTFNCTNKSIVCFSDHQHLYIELSTVAQALIRFLAEGMSVEENEVINHPAERQEFIRYARKSLNQKYEDATIRKAYNELYKMGYLIDRRRSKRFCVNPLYYTRATAPMRDALIGSLLKEACKPGSKNIDIISKLKLKDY